MVKRASLAGMPNEIKDMIFDQVFAQPGTVYLHIENDCREVSDYYKTSQSATFIDEVRPHVELIIIESPDVVSSESWLPQDMLPMNLFLAMQLVNREFRNFGQPRIYGQNTFRFEGRHSWWALSFFLHCLRNGGSNTAEFVRLIDISPWYEIDMYHFHRTHFVGSKLQLWNAALRDYLSCISHYAGLAFSRLARHTTVTICFPVTIVSPSDGIFEGLEVIPSNLAGLMRSDEESQIGGLIFTDEFVWDGNSLGIW